MAEEPVTIIDREVLRVLSVDTRMDILKILSEGARTPSFLSKKLDKSNPTIVEHLDTMVKVGLVKKTTSPGKKWVFYSLTDRGKGIISSKSRRLVIVLATSFIALLGGAASLGRHYLITEPPLAFGEMAKTTPADSAPIATIAAQHPPIFLYASIILFAVAAVGFGFYAFRKYSVRSLYG